MIDVLKIRRVEPGNKNDVAAAARLLTELNEIVGALGVPEEVAHEPQYSHISAEQFEHRLRQVEKIETVLLAEIAGQAVGFTALRLVPHLDQDTPYAEVTQMYTRAANRRQGVGLALIETAERMALAAGATCVHIITDADNHDAHEFYEAAGYHVACHKFEKHFPSPRWGEGQGEGFNAEGFNTEGQTSHA